jgi:hypothetical protein
MRVAILLGVTLAVAAPAAAQDNKDKGKDKDGKPPVTQLNTPPVPVTQPAPIVSAPAPSGGCGTITVCVTERVPETYTTTRTAYKQVCVAETYQGFRCETFPVTRTRNVTTYVSTPVCRDVVSTVCERVPCVETRTVMRSHWTTVQETVMKHKRVDHGHYECQEVPDHFRDFCNRLKYRCHHDCCECPPCPATRTVKCWKSCWVDECYPCTVCKRVCTQVPETCQVTTYKTITKQVSHKVTTYVCTPVTRAETYTCNETRQVPFTGTRNVTRCVPYQETVTCTRMVSRTVQRQVPAPSACECECTPCCSSSRHHGAGLLSGWFGGRGHGHSHGDCDSCH